MWWTHPNASGPAEPAVTIAAPTPTIQSVALMAGRTSIDASLGSKSAGTNMHDDRYETNKDVQLLSLPLK